ncbi:MAG: 2-amino-4-hydroxy-6-hydroxymethyldihydropteridine diphosphokinase [Candidatus Omnitrophota bacterium]
MTVCYLGLGSNLGNRRKNISMALEKIKALPQTKILKASRLMATQPQGGPVGQGEFLNAVLKIKTSLSPAILLKKLKIIEQQTGRKKSPRWGPRIIDLDILFYGNSFIKRKGLSIPHPRLFEREFVIKPLLGVL